jgi:hypothetical protein
MRGVFSLGAIVTFTVIRTHPRGGAPGGIMNRRFRFSRAGHPRSHATREQIWVRGFCPDGFFGGP